MGFVFVLSGKREIIESLAEITVGKDESYAEEKMDCMVDECFYADGYYFIAVVLSGTG